MKEYLTNELAIIWKPELCQKSGICVKMIPEIYKPDESPWIQPEGITDEEIVNSIHHCPSGALSYRFRYED